VLDHPDSVLLGIDKLAAIEDRQDAVSAALMEVRDEQEERATKR
jgi:hypothetical protein